jgi:hypothetical protein
MSSLAKHVLRRFLPTSFYGLNTLRTELLVLNPATGQATVLGTPAALRGLIHDIAWSPDGSTLYALGDAGVSGFPAPRLLHTLAPDAGAILSTVMITGIPPLEHRSSNRSERLYGPTPSPSMGEGRGGGEVWHGSWSPSLPLPPHPNLPPPGGKGQYLTDVLGHRMYHVLGGFRKHPNVVLEWRADAARSADMVNLSRSDC